MKPTKTLEKAAPGLQSAGSTTLQNLQKAYNNTKLAKAAWKQPKMTNNQQAAYAKVSQGITNPNLSVEQINQLADPMHPMISFLTPSDHANAYKYWFKQAEALPEGDPQKKIAENNSMVHHAHMMDKRQV
jgi:hypothetical protein